MEVWKRIQEILTEAAYSGRLPSLALIGHVKGGSVTLVSGAFANPESTYPLLFRHADNFPTLAALLLGHSDVPSQNALPDLKKEGGFLVAFVGYLPHLADFGMSYRNSVKYVISASPFSPRRCWSCWQVNQNGDPARRVPLTVPVMPAHGGDAADEINKILTAELTGAPRLVPLDASALTKFKWLDHFVPSTRSVIPWVPKHYQEVQTWNLEGVKPKYKWCNHTGLHADDERFWTLVTLYSVFTWAIQLPTFREFEFKPQDVERAKSDERNYGRFLDGLNVSGLLLDPNLRPRAWSFNSNKINKTLHAETALCLAWLKRAQAEGFDPPYKGYTFLSPWHSCAMCASWISEVFEDCRVIWFIDDPGLPYTHLEYGERGNTEIFLPRKISKNFKNTAIGRSVYQRLVRALGKTTCYDYNPGYQDVINKVVYGTPRPESGKKASPPELFGSEWYFNTLAEAWDLTRTLPTEVERKLIQNSDYQSYWANIWMLRRNILAFDELNS